MQITPFGGMQSQDLYIQQNRTAIPVLHLHTFAFITGCPSRSKQNQTSAQFFLSESRNLQTYTQRSVYVMFINAFT